MKAINTNRGASSALLFITVFLLVNISAAFAQSETKITADDAAVNDYFGVSVSINGDYAIVGAHGDDDFGDRSGSAYIFVREGDDWTEQSKLTAEDAAEGKRFGNSVSISGDYAVVGAPRYDEYSGSAYIFTRDGENWTEQSKLTADDSTAYDQFGYSVSISGDYAVVGAYNTGRSGSAYIFVRDGADWTQQAKLTEDEENLGDCFGWSVSISGDYAIIGTRGDLMSIPDSGSAYIFVRDGANWTQRAKLTADDPAEYDGFGWSVSISGDYAVVGALGDDDNYGSSGSAYIFARDGADWTRQAKLTADDAMEGNYFGGSVSISGDYAVIGAHHDDDGGYGSGSAYIFVRDGAEWTQQAKLTADDAAVDDYFGHSVSISGDLAIVGAIYDDDGGNMSGSAYIYNLTENNIEWRGDMADIPVDFGIVSAYPNPFNSTTTIKYGLPCPGHVTLRIYNPLGQQVGTLFEGFQLPGFHTATLNAGELPSGLYFVRLITNDEEFTQKVMLIR